MVENSFRASILVEEMTEAGIYFAKPHQKKKKIIISQLTVEAMATKDRISYMVSFT